MFLFNLIVLMAEGRADQNGSKRRIRRTRKIVLKMERPAEYSRRVLVLSLSVSVWCVSESYP
jgi:hypothetical protein